MILVIGATGTVGREVVNLLTAQNINTRAFTRFPDKAALTKSEYLEIFQGDLSDLSSIKAALGGVQRVFMVTPSCPHQVEWEGNAIHAITGTNCRYVVKLSTLGANPDSASLICRWQGRSEEQIKASGVPYTFLRCHNFMQNTFSFAPSISSEGFFRAPWGKAKITMVDVRDIAEVAVKLLLEDDHRGSIYRLTGPEAVSYYQAADSISKAISRKVEYMEATPGEFRGMMMETGLPAWQIDELLNLYLQFRNGGGQRVWDDIPNLLGKPARSFAQFAKDYGGVFKGNPFGNKVKIL